SICDFGLIPRINHVAGTTFEIRLSKSASIEVEIDEQYVAVYTICAAHLNCKFPDRGYNR
ncbi:hypothetical protein Q5692_33060, partial [Microcoleus sp. C2C3]|uniref:hypothetical protein n=1 Tax=unclassified Microcoleus TaxID=2642155 RepID=UPI002FCE9FD6